MSNSGRNMNTPERNKCLLGSGLFNDYESRLGLRRLSLKSNTSLSERISARSPNRSNYKFDKLPGDENLTSKRSATCAENDMTNPIRSGLSPFRSTPFSYSKRSNINNAEPGNLPNAADSSNNSRVALLMEHNSSSKLLSCNEKCPSTFAGRMITVANQMDCDQFPWVAYNGSIPMILSSPHRSTSSLANVNSPSGDVNGSFRNRVRVRLSKPVLSNASVLNSDVDNSSNLDESSTTKSVIQVLKEIARKRCLATDEEEEHEGLPQAKRRTQHNLYLSRLEREEELVPAQQTRTNGEDERTKRTRDPDWDTPNVSKPKRPRKNYNFINNEIISSLSSSIGLHALKINGRKKPSRKSIAVQVQTLVPEEIDEERKEKVLRSRTNQLQPSPPKTTRDTGVLTDPLPEPRPRSPVKEKVVSDVNGILKSALTKFDIQPSASTAGPDNITNSPLSSLVPPTIPVAQSTIDITESQSTSLVTQFSSSNQIVTSSLTSIETTASSSFSLATSKSTFTPVTSPAVFMAPVSTPQITFGIPSVLSEKPTESIQSVEKEKGKLELLPEVNQEQPGFKLESKQALKSESPFKFGVPLSDSNVKPSVSQPQTVTSALFNFKVPETSASVQVPVTSSPAFSFGTPKVQEPTNGVKVTEEPKTIFGGTLTTPVATLSTPVASLLHSSKTELSPLTVTANNNSDQRKESLKSTSGFSFLSKLTEPGGSSGEEKKEVISSGIFTFGKPETKIIPESNSLSESKPFQFGSGGFSFGQANKTNSGEPSNIAGSQSISSTPSTTTTQAGFNFSSGATKKDEKPGGFTFNAPVKNINEPKSLFTFNATTASSVTSAPSSFVSTTTVASAKPFPSSLFGNSSENSNVLTSTVTTTTNSLASNPNIATATFGTTCKPTPTLGLNNTTSTASAFGLNNSTSTAPTFGLNNATSSASTFRSTESPKLIFGGGSNPPTFGSTLNNAPVFGSNVKKETNKPPAFGSSTTRNNLNPPAFGIGVPSTSNSVPTFGSVAAGNNNNPPAFGSSAVGSSSQTGFGVTVAATAGSKNSTFGSSTTNANVPNFGSALAGGTGSATFGNTTVNRATPSQPFGSSSVGTSTSAFGGSGTNNATSFGNTPAFGSSSVPTFGTSNSTNFGVSALSTPAFGNQPQQSFSNQAGTSFGSTSAFGQNSTTPAFGGQSTFGNPSTNTQAFGSTPTFGNSGVTFGSSSVPAASGATFGSSSVPAASGATFGSSSVPAASGATFGSSSVPAASGATFGSSSVPAASGATFGSSSVPAASSATFGSSSIPAASGATFGSSSVPAASGATFGSSSVPAATPAFGATTTSAFGSSSGFGNQESNKPFTFNAPASQPAQSGTFNFTSTAPQPQQGSGCLFQFGAGSTSTPTNQPFQFNASQSSAPGFTAGFSPGVGGTGQQMFSIGSGSTAPRRVTGRRKK